MNIDRRQILQAAAGTAAFAGLGAGKVSAARQRPFRVGVIGAGWFGKLNLNCLMQVAPVEAVALCDVDRRMLEDAGEKTQARKDSLVPPKAAPALYDDYREMLAGHEFDIVIVGTPDHWHALPAIAAMEAGAQVYLEKPVSVDIAEGRALVAAARKYKRVVQAGTQRRSAPFVLEARDRVLRERLAGRIGMVELFGYFHQRPASFAEESTPPEHLDWDAYCGPAPLLPYRADIHPRLWRAFAEFGNGYMGDIGVHFIDTCRFLLELGWPNRISSAGGVFVDRKSPSTVPDTQTAVFEFDDLLMTWTNRQWGRPGDPHQWGAHIHGDKGTLTLTSTGYEFHPRGNGGKVLTRKFEPEYDTYPEDQDLPDWEHALASLTRHHMRNFISAIESGTRPVADIEEGHISTSCCILANMALKLSRPLEWDAAAQTVKGDAEANKMLARPYREPWEHPSSG